MDYNLKCHSYIHFLSHNRLPDFNQFTSNEKIQVLFALQYILVLLIRHFYSTNKAFIFIPFLLHSIWSDCVFICTNNKVDVSWIFDSVSEYMSKRGFLYILQVFTSKLLIGFLIYIQETRNLKEKRQSNNLVQENHSKIFMRTCFQILSLLEKSKRLGKQLYTKIPQRFL